MKRKILLLSFLIPKLALASFYVGLGAGPEFGNFNQTATVVNPFTNVKDSTNYSGNGIFGSLFAGYGGYYKRYYLAAEINGNISSLAFQSSNDNFLSSTFNSTHYRMQNSYGFSVLPGYSIMPLTLLYGRLGYVNGNFKISTTDVSLANINRYLSGIRYGLGLNQTFTDHWHGRMEYSKINYQSTSFTVLTGITTKSTTISPSINQVEFALIYQFS